MLTDKKHTDKTGAMPLADLRDNHMLMLKYSRRGARPVQLNNF